MTRREKITDEAVLWAWYMGHRASHIYYATNVYVQVRNIIYVRHSFQSCAFHTLLQQNPYNNQKQFGNSYPKMYFLHISLPKQV